MRALRSAFTTVELLVAMAVLILLFVVLLGITTQTASTWRYSTAKAEQFQEARRAYEVVSRRLSQATLNTYWDYLYSKDANGNPDTTKPPSSYIRQSELRFRSGQMSTLLPATTRGAPYHPTHGVFFQATFGLTDTIAYKATDDLLNAWGYFVELGNDSDQLPPFLQGITPSLMRFRLMEFRQSTETLTLYQLDPNLANDSWFTAPLYLTGTTRPARVMANNIVALIVLPKLSAEDQTARNSNPRVATKYRMLSPTYDYDSKKSSNYVPPVTPPDPDIDPRNQLPPIVQLGMVAIDDLSARKLATQGASKQDLGLKTSDLFLQANVLDVGPSGQAQDSDLSKFEQRLIAAKLSYRFYMSNVALRAAKWSRSDTN